MSKAELMLHRVLLAIMVAALLFLLFPGKQEPQCDHVGTEHLSPRIAPAK